MKASVTIYNFPPPSTPTEMDFAPRRQTFKLSSVREEKVYVFDKIINGLLMENEI